MKILIITQKVDIDDPVLGFFHGWIDHLSYRFDSIKVVALSKGVYSFQKNVEVVSLGKEFGSNKIIQVFRLYSYFFNFLPNIDGIFVHMAPEYVQAIYPINLFFKKPIIMWYAHIKVSQIALWALSKVDKILTPSKESFSFNSNKVIASGHGVDTEIFKPLYLLPQKVPVIMALSRISRVKRLEVFIESLRILRNVHPELSFQAIIVGDPILPQDLDYEKELHELADKYGLGSFLEWKGAVKNNETPQLYNLASVFVRLQGGGGFGKTELEAMACGTPVVLSTDVHNNKLLEFANDLYFREDDARACAENIYRVLCWNNLQRDSYAKLARGIVVENHNLEKLADRISIEFSKILKK